MPAAQEPPAAGVLIAVLAAVGTQIVTGESAAAPAGTASDTSSAQARANLDPEHPFMPAP